MKRHFPRCRAISKTAHVLAIVVVSVLMTSSTATAQFTYQPPGDLVSGSGTGLADYDTYVPGMRFPIEQSPAFANSQVWGHGGMNGPGGGQCDSNNYSYPWWDNYCESRQWDMPFCPSGQGHQGQDIRPGSCEDKTHWSVAAEDGSITNIGSYSVNLTTADGTLHRYLHMDPGTLAVNVGDTVSKGQRLGLVSNAFGGTSTTIHLHYDIRQNVSGMGQVYVPTYMSLVRSYQDLIGQPEEACGVLGVDGGIIDDGESCFRLLGNIATWRMEQAGHGGSLRWTYAYDGDDPDGYARWIFHFEQAGSYRVEAYIESDFAESAQARYIVKASGAEQEIRLNQAASDGWTELGEFDFAGDDQEWLEVYDNTGEAFSEGLRFVADAIRLTRIEEESDPGADAGGGEPGDEEPDAGFEVDAGHDGDLDDPGDDEDLEDLSGHRNNVVATRSCAQTEAPQPLTVVLFGMVGLCWGVRRSDH